MCMHLDLALLRRGLFMASLPWLGLCTLAYLGMLSVAALQWLALLPRDANQPNVSFPPSTPKRNSCGFESGRGLITSGERDCGGIGKVVGVGEVDETIAIEVGSPDSGRSVATRKGAARDIRKAAGAIAEK